MITAHARELLSNTFTGSFDKNRYRAFIRQLLNHIDEHKAASWNHPQIREMFTEHVDHYERLATYTSPDRKKLDVLVVHITEESKLERARTAMRNFIADHLKNSDTADAALVAFVPPKGRTWRFSFVKMEYEALQRQTGRIAVQPLFTPARRYSYLVGEGESCHTAQSRFVNILTETQTDPTLSLIEEAFSIETVTKQFYSEIANWYFWALHYVHFPVPKGTPDVDSFTAQNLIRLITRLIFCWFVKKKGLIPEQLFSRDHLRHILKNGDKLETSRNTIYYKAILQNLFFATLNQEMERRSFRNRNKNAHGRDPHRGVTNLYRYQDHFHDPGKFLRMMNDVPFLNGGLFECLDRVYRTEEKCPDIRIDGFSDHPKNPLKVPDFLFFAPDCEVDLSRDYGEASYRYAPVRGLIYTFSRYNFTVSESTPLDQDVALDPELSGKVFENLLAAYNPETATTARKQTGSFYTPRPIVDYMVDECLSTYLASAIGGHEAALWDKIRGLISYDEQEHSFTAAEVSQLIRAVDDLRALDPACGSGAFPMGLLQKLVYVLSKLDPRNEQWESRQIERVWETIRAAEKIQDSAIRERTTKDLESHIGSIREAFRRNELDYGRKLFLIENCIYGVDIQPIAVQIAKMRFFISLIVDQSIDPDRPNFGIRPLPNLETKFVAANSLIGIDRPAQQTLRNPQIDELELELHRIREQHFTARTPATKAKYRQRDAELRSDISELLQQGGFSRNITEMLARWDPYDQNSSADFFDPEWMFGVRKGFHITIGNPPYVRADEQSDWNRRQRKSVLASGQYDTLWEKWDLFIAFIERAYKLLVPNGITTLIVSDAYCHSKYAQKSQEWFLRNARILRLDFCSDIRIFDAAVHNLIYFFQHADGQVWPPERRHHSGAFGDVSILETDIQSNLTHRAFFPSLEPARPYLSVATMPMIPLGAICYISYGLRPNSDESTSQGEFVTADVVSEKPDKIHCRPFVDGEHLCKWLPIKHLWIEWGTKRAPSRFCRPTFPELHDAPEKIIARKNCGANPMAIYDSNQLVYTSTGIGAVPWHYLQDIRNNSLKKSARYPGEKPLRPDLPNRKDHEATSRRFLVKYLLAVMNSAPAREFLRAHRRHNVSLYPDDWKHLPIPAVSRDKQRTIIDLVDKILSSRRSDPRADLSIWEGQLDQMIRALYGVRK